MSTRVSPLQLLRGEQADASHPRRHVWLSASAGTGKTHVLSARVLRLLLNGADPATILCLTFTKAGAAEMAERIQARLASWVHLREQDLRKELHALGEAHGEEQIRAARRLFARVLDATGGGLRIQTIHAFSQTLLAAFPAEAGLAPGFRPLEGRAEAALARATLGGMLVEAERGGDLGLIADVQMLSRRMGETAAERYLMLCARSPRAMAALGSRHGIEPRVRTALGAWLGDIEARLADECADGRFDCAGLRAMAAANLSWGTKTGQDHAGVAHSFLAAEGPARAAMLDDLAATLFTRTGERRALSAKLIGCDPDHEGNCTRLAETLEALLGQRRKGALSAAIAAGLRAGQAYAQAYAEAKRAAGLVDFDDLIRLVLDLLERPGIGEWIRYKLDQRTDHLLIDEGQDTNANQWRIVRALAEDFFAEEPQPGAPATRTLFSVGDFKQAIFGFQGTDPVAFAAAREYFERTARQGRQKVERLSLDRSFRSTPPILAVVDRVVADLGQDALGLTDAPEPHRSAKDGKPGTVTLLAPVIAETVADDDPPGEEGWADDAERLLAAKLARQIGEWLKVPVWLPVRRRPLRPEDVLILVRKRGSLASLLVARLHEEGVPVAGVDRLRLNAPLAVQDLVAAVRFVLAPEDDLTLASLLVSPLFGCTQDELYRVAHPRTASLWLAVSRDPAMADTAAGLRRMLDAADFSTPYGFLEGILSGPLQGRVRLLERLGEEARDPIEELLNAALLFEGEATASLQRFLDWFDRGEVEVTRDPSAPLDAVRVMTVHGAKGLQAPLVILADATGDPDLQPGRPLRWALEDEAVPIPAVRKAERMGSIGEAADEARRLEREEHWRLLYVAATRAEEWLVIGGALGPRARGMPPGASWYQALAGAMEGLGAQPVDDPLWGSARTYRGEGGSVSAVPAAAARPAVARPALPLPAWLREAAPEERRPPRPLAPSAPDDDDTPDSPPSAAMRDAARRGQLLHALFQRLPPIAPDERHAVAVRWLIRSAGLDDEAAAARLARDACHIIADPAHQALFSPAALAEAPIAAVVEGGHVVAGTVDRLLVAEDRVTIVDFKTGRLVPGSAEAAPPAHLRQMAAYAGALRVIFPDRPVEALLLYTAGPRLLALPPDLLAAHKPGFASAEQKQGGLR